MTQFDSRALGYVIRDVESRSEGEAADSTSRGENENENEKENERSRTHLVRKNRTMRSDDRRVQ